MVGFPVPDWADRLAMRQGASEPLREDSLPAFPTGKETEWCLPEHSVTPDR
jgi:hypothetical protein